MPETCEPEDCGELALLPPPPSELGEALEDLIRAGLVLTAAVEAGVPSDLLHALVTDVWVLSRFAEALHRTGILPAVGVREAHAERARLLRLISEAEGVEFDRLDIAYLLRSGATSPEGR